MIAAESAFERQVRAYSGELFRFAYWLCRDRSMAEDLVQETFARAWRARHQLRDENALKPWLYHILRNEHARAYERKSLPMDDCELEDLPITDAANLEQDLAVREQVTMLAPGYREPLLLQVLGGFSCAEIATFLGISEAAVMQRLTRARLMLRRLWLGEAEPGGKRRELGS
jgi:RNA polymerase sigma-70 factor, ECF subfamily